MFWDKDHRILWKHILFDSNIDEQYQKFKKTNINKVTEEPVGLRDTYKL